MKEKEIKKDDIVKLVENKDEIPKYFTVLNVKDITKADELSKLTLVEVNGHYRRYIVSESEVEKVEIGEDLLEYLTKFMSEIVNDHIEFHKDLYWRKDIESIKVELKQNINMSALTNMISDFFEKSLTQEEKSFAISLFKYQLLKDFFIK